MHPGRRLMVAQRLPATLAKLNRRYILLVITAPRGRRQGMHYRPQDTEILS